MPEGEYGLSPDDAGQAAVLVLLGGPGYGRGRYVVGPQPGRGGLCGVQLKDRGNKGDSSGGGGGGGKLFGGLFTGRGAQHMDEHPGDGCTLPCFSISVLRGLLHERRKPRIHFA